MLKNTKSHIRKRCLTACSIAGLALLAPGASAHVGAVVAKAAFVLPPAPLALTDADGGVTWTYAPAEADAHYLFAWQDGDNDPTGRFTFYYLEYTAPTAAPVSAIGGTTSPAPLAHPVIDVGGRAAAGIWISCACAAQDAASLALDSSAPPSCFDGGPRWCDNEVDWDTSAIADGVYWLYAVNDDPPYHEYGVSAAPVRIAHGAHRPPIVIVVYPDGLGAVPDTLYRGGVIARGDGPLTLSLSWGIDTAESWRDPVQGFAGGLPAIPGADGLVDYQWDVSALMDGSYFVSAVVQDGSGAVSFSDSRYGVSVFHAGDAGVPDLAADASRLLDASRAGEGGAATANHTGPGCGCALSRRAPESEDGALVALLIAVLAISRRGLRSGSRSGCTG